jgi:hypothetical protein
MNGLQEDWTLVVHSYVLRSISAGRPAGLKRRIIKPTTRAVITPPPDNGGQLGPWTPEPAGGHLVQIHFLKEKGVWRIDGYLGITDTISEVLRAKACTDMPGDDSASWPTPKH